MVPFVRCNSPSHFTPWIEIYPLILSHLFTQVHEVTEKREGVLTFVTSALERSNPIHFPDYSISSFQRLIWIEYLNSMQTRLWSRSAAAAQHFKGLERKDGIVRKVNRVGSFRRRSDKGKEPFSFPIHSVIRGLQSELWQPILTDFDQDRRRRRNTSKDWKEKME